MSDVPTKQPKFKVGQVVMMKSLKKNLPFSIIERLWHEDEWFYKWNRRNAAAEHEIRELTTEERGDHN